LTNLNWLDLSANPIALKTCPIEPESICQWDTVPCSSNR
jgi:hypothetical protein